MASIRNIEYAAIVRQDPRRIEQRTVEVVPVAVVVAVLRRNGHKVAS